MSKLNQINGYMQINPHKLQPIREDFVRLDTSCQEWTFPPLVEALINEESKRDQPSRNGRLLQINQRRQKCAYRNAGNHISSSCNKIKTVDESSGK